MKKKTLYIDGLGLVDGHFSGIGQYILGILRGLDELTEINKLHNISTPDIKVIIPRDEIKKFKKFGFKHIGYKKFPLPFRYMAALWHRGKLPPIDLICGRGTYIFPRFVGMPLLFSKSACVIYDLSYELHREFSDEGNARFLSAGVQRTLKNAGHVITISDNAKKEITDFYNIDPQNVSVATPATDPAVFYRRSNSEVENIKRKYSIEGDYILALSNLEPRKNLGSLVEAYSALPNNITEQTSLLLVGVSGWKTESLFNDIVKRVGEGANIIRPSKYVLDKDKPAVISGAKMLVYPSHYEGFGMPPVEALACGVPVIAANNSSLPQAVGTAGKLVQSTDITAIKNTMLDVFKNYETVLDKTSREGPKQANNFSWLKSAQVFLDTAERLEK
jgi:glycosyltransferase involved in cell wall biosynthesis